VIVAAMTDERTAPHFNGLRLRGALIEGPFELSWAELPCPLVLEECRITDRVLIADTKAKEVVLEGCHLLKGLEGPRLRADGRVDFTGCTLLDDLQLYDARLGGDLLLTDATVQSATGPSIRAEGIHVGADLALNGGFVATGGVALDQARVMRSVWLDESKINAGPAAPCVSLAGTRIEGNVTCILSEFESPHGACLNAAAAKIDGEIDCSGGRFIADEWAIGLDNAEVGGSITLSVTRDEHDALVRFEADGGVRMAEAKIGKQLNCRGGIFRSTGPPALSAASADIAGSVFLGRATDGQEQLRDSDGDAVHFEAHGAVTLQRAKIRASLICSGGRFTNPSGFALDLYSAEIAGDAMFEAPLGADMSLIEDSRGDPLRFEALGTVRLHGLRVSDQLSFRGAMIAAEVTALDGRMLEVGRSAHFDPQRNRAGTVLDSKHRSARFEIGSFVGIEGSPAGFEERGVLQLIGAHIHGDVNFLGARLTAVGDDLALEANDMTVEDSFVWRDVECRGRVKLRNAAVDVLEDEASCWATGVEDEDLTVDLDHFTYQSLARETDWKVRRRWLRRQPDYSPYSYSVLAQSYRRLGDDESARKISMERVEEQVRRRGYKKGDPRRVFRWLLKYTIGHGYEPWRALYWAAGLWILAWVTIAFALANHAVVATRASSTMPPPSPTNCHRTDYPCLTPPLLAADLLVPVVTLGQRDFWRVNGAVYYRVIIGVLVVAGWMLTTMVVAGFTGLVRRE
jgi:hypothetical protein